MTLAERIKAAIGIIEGKQTAAQAEVASLTKAANDAVTAQQAAEAQTAAVTAQLATANDALAAAQTDTQAETDAVVALEALAAQP